MRKTNVVVVGATGMVGQVFLRIAEERRFPVDRLRLSASPRSIGKRLLFNGDEVEVEETNAAIFRDADFVFISASGAVSRQLAPLAVEAGAVVIDDSSAFRMDPQVPLVVPEINGDDLVGHKGLTSIPNCSTTPMVMALHPLHRVNPVKRIIADTYQSVSGTGGGAMAELREQSRALLETGESPPPEVYPHRIAFNVLPQVEHFLENGYTNEERKMAEETRKIMHAPEIAVSATCVRVPVYVSHSVAIHAEFERPMSPAEARELLSAFPGVTVLDDPEAGQYPVPLDAEGKDDVFVGRIRTDTSNPNGLAMWAVSDNLRKGAALNAIQIAEEILSRDLLPSRKVG
ncbi:MAG: aspartate-semialdehyde dehydrogenase [Chloroflexi bacterium]|nr:aspartate-semialdehyde dehydrogenase [Chloroflexota bacterium]